MGYENMFTNEEFTALMVDKLRVWRNGGIIQRGDIEVLEEESIPVSLCLPKIPHWLACVRTRPNPRGICGRRSGSETGVSAELEGIPTMQKWIIYEYIYIYIYKI